MSGSGPSQDEREAALEQARALRKSGRGAEAVEILRGLAKSLLTVNLAVDLAQVLRELAQYEEAAHWARLAARHRPENPELRRLMGNILADLGRVEEAEAEYRAALAADPEHDSTKLALTGLLLSLGRYAEGWPLMEVRAKLKPSVVPPIALPYPEWKGEPLDGKSILVWWEQGLGDQIQMCRFAGSLKARGAAKVTLGCRPALVDLLATTPGADAIIPVPQGAGVPVPRHHYWTRYFSAPLHLGITLETLPKEPYLFAPADRLARWRGFSGIGLAWRASPTGFNASHKNVPDEQAKRLLDLGAVSLHPEDTGVKDFADTAAIMAQLDLVISIDTSVAHLAGAMGKRCWTLLPRVNTDWRWLRERTDSPWYPSMRLYRQQEPGRWDPVIDQVIADLEAGLA
jgi:tetratricopeptide (TPR) repeat protein